MSKVRKPCRYKACKGVIHQGKCPIASSRGKKGGSGKKSETWIQNRIGSKNPNFKGTRKCGCPIRQHLPNCSQSRMSKIKINATSVRDTFLSFRAYTRITNLNIKPSNAGT